MAGRRKSKRTFLSWVTGWMMERKDSLGRWGGELKSELNLGHVMFQVSVGQPSEEDY